MSILINDINPPNNCYECQFIKWVDDGCAGCLADNKIHNASRPINCPLVEIPVPHGRLIDADAYCEDLLKEAHKVFRLLKPETIERINRTVDDLKKYPAIIEAEGGDDE